MPITTSRYVTGYNYEDNSPAFTDYVARGRRHGGMGAPPHDARADLGRNDFDNPSSLAIGPEAGLAYGSRVFIEDYGWFLVEDQTDSGLSHAPRFDVWTAGATQAELNSLTGWRDVTVWQPGEPIDAQWMAQGAGSAWDWLSWTSEARLADFRARPTWHGLYREGVLLQ